MPGSERSICSEVIALELHGTRAKAPASIVQPLLISDLPVFLRWRGEPPWGSPELDQIVGVTDRLIVDSTEWDDLPYPYRRLAELFERTAVSDIAWSRTSRWRALLASLWPDIADVAHDPRARARRRRRCLLAGWLRSRLGRDDIALELDERERLEGIDLDGEPAPFPPGDPPSPSDVLSDELDRFTRDPVYEAAVRAIAPKESGAVGASYSWMLAELEALYRSRLPEFRRVAAGIAGDRELGCDAVQEAFASAVRKRRSFRGSGTLEAWVWRIVVNAARDARRRRPALVEPHEPSANGHAPVLPLDLLTERQREIVFLHYYADLDYAAIAAALAISPGTVGATLNAARQTLRERTRGGALMDDLLERQVPALRRARQTGTTCSRGRGGVAVRGGACSLAAAAALAVLVVAPALAVAARAIAACSFRARPTEQRRGRSCSRRPDASCSRPRRGRATTGSAISSCESRGLRAAQGSRHGRALAAALRLVRSTRASHRERRRRSAASTCR